MKADYKRHILKTISYRILGSSITVCTAWFFGAPLELASLIGFTEIAIKPFFYFIHERFWYRYIKMK